MGNKPRTHALEHSLCNGRTVAPYEYISDPFQRLCSASSDRMNYPDTAVAGTRSTSQHATGHGLGVLSLDSPPLSTDIVLGSRRTC
jgi:hypothetical protein